MSIIGKEKFIDRSIISDSTKSKIMKVDSETSHLPIDTLQEGKTYQSHIREILQIKKIDHKKQIIFFRNISQSSNEYKEFKHINLVKQF